MIILLLVDFDISILEILNYKSCALATELFEIHEHLITLAWSHTLLTFDTLQDVLSHLLSFSFQTLQPVVNAMMSYCIISTEIDLFLLVGGKSKMYNTYSFNQDI
jgi:hypothetical protein